MTAREELERMDVEAKRGLRKLRMAWTKETNALRSIPHCGSTWQSVIEYGELFALPLNDRYRPILSKSGATNSLHNSGPNPKPTVFWDRKQKRS